MSHHAPRGGCVEGSITHVSAYSPRRVCGGQYHPCLSILPAAGVWRATGEATQLVAEANARTEARYGPEEPATLRRLRVGDMILDTPPCGGHDTGHSPVRGT